MKTEIGKVVIEDAYAVKDDYDITEAEKKLEEIVTDFPETEYNHKIAQEKNWAVLFSLSHIRWNAVEWLPVEKKDRVLEIGSQEGSLTGILAEKAGAVTCIEPSTQKCRINALRNRERENIEIYNGAYRDVVPQLEEKYDWIFMIGAFEAGRMLMDGTAPYRDLLVSAKELLAPGGSIVIASQNRLGLRYFAGCREEYSGKYFGGMEGYREDVQKRTFSRPELEKIIRSAGLEEMQFYYPYPDYRLPMTIYSDEHLPKVGELWDNLRNFDRERYLMFDESKAFDQIIEDGLFPVFSNSYLVVIREKKSADTDVKRTIFSKYSNERAAKFAIRTDIQMDGAGRRYARKVACYPEGKEHIDRLEHWMEALDDAYKSSGMTMNRCRRTEVGTAIDFLTGQTLEEQMDHFLLEGQTEEAIALLMKYIEVIKKSGSCEQFVVTEEFEKVFGEVLLPEDLTCAKVTDIDMVTGNVICTGDGWIHMDYEWTFDFPIPVNYVVFRIIQNYLYGNVERSALYKELLYKKAGLTEQEIAQYTCMEQSFQKYITGEHIPLRYLYEEISPGCVNFQAEEAHRQEIARANAEANQGIEVFVDTFEIAMTGIHVNGWAVSKADKQVHFALLDEQNRELDLVKTDYLYRRDVAERFKLSGKSSKAGFRLEFRLPEQAQKNRKFTLLAKDGISEVHFLIPVEKLRIKQSRIGKKLMDLRGARDVISYIAPHEMGLFGEGKVYRVENQRFDTWRMAHRFTEEERVQQEKVTFVRQPEIAVLMHIGEGNERLAEYTRESLEKQTWKKWKLLTGREAQNLSGMSGDYVLLMEAGDTLEPGALYEMVKYLNQYPDTQMLYSDSDKWDPQKKEYFDPQFKPDDSPYTLQSGNYIGNSIWIKKELAERAGGIHPEYGRASVYDLILRCRELAGSMAHMSRLLYHQNCPMERNLAQRQELVREWEEGKQVLQDYYAKKQIPAQVTWANYPLRYRVKWQVQGSPKISVIIPNQDHIGDLDQCLRSIAKKTTYSNYEVLVVENNSKRAETFAYYKKMQERYSKVRLLTWEKEFNYSAINNFAAKQSEGEYLIFLNNDTEILTEDWMEEMLSVCQQPDVGVVGSKLYYPDGTIQHAGVILGLSNIAGHLFVKEPGDISGYMGRACTMQNLSAVTAACMMASRECFEKVAGFEEILRVALNDVDFCMKVQKIGKQVVYNPEAELYHYESKSRGLEDTPEKLERYNREVSYFRSRWGEVLEKGDPYYNVNLSRTTWNCTFRIPPETEKKGKE